MKKNDFEIQETILETLKVSKVNGFPFFAYTGIKDFVFMGNRENAEVMLKNIPRNPHKISAVNIAYDFGADLYNVSFYRKKNGIIYPVESLKGIYFDQLSELIVRKMGVQ
jgi:hypothetical protein